MSAARPDCDGRAATIVGTSQDNTINGTSGRDVIVGKGGKDVIHGRGGRDRVCGGTGRDFIDGGDGNDRLFGGSGNDGILGDAGNDDLFGSIGNDIIRGEAGNDDIDGGAGIDDCSQGAGTGSTQRCEEADLSVEVRSPASAAGNTDITFTIDVTNLGPAAVSYSLSIGDDNHGATCPGGDEGGTFPQPVLGVGDTRSRDHIQNCTIEGDDPKVWVEAEVSGYSDSNDANDSQTSETLLTPP